MKAYVESHQILAVFFFVTAGFVAWHLRYLLLLFFASYVIGAGLRIPVLWLKSASLPKWLALISVYFVIFGVIVGALFLLGIPFAYEMATFVQAFPEYIEELSQIPILSNIQFELTNLFSTIRGYMVGFATNMFSAIFNILLAFIASAYFVARWDKLRDGFSHLLGEEHAPRMQKFSEQAESKVGAWFRGQIALVLIIGLATYLGLLLLGIQFALVLGVFAGLMEFVPFIGPIIAAIPALIIAVSISPLTALLVLILYIVIQQLEAYFVVPLVMNRALELDPLVIIFGVLVGYSILGIAGALLAVPFMAIVWLAVNMIRTRATL